MDDTNEASVAADEWGRTAVIVGHPGHELTVYHWIECHQPLYFCLTDGSGGAAQSRLASTDRILQELGVGHGPIFGRYPDKDLYRLLLDGRVDVLMNLVRELAEALIDANVESVVGDAVEGFNPVHDLCRFLIDGAVARVRNQTGRVIRNYDFVLDSQPDSCPELFRNGAKWLSLSVDALDRKIAAALAYPELRDEVTKALARFGRNAFARECLRPVTTRWLIEQFESELPAYERYGQMRVEEGRYREIIRYRDHVWPVIAAIEEMNRQ